MQARARVIAECDRGGRTVLRALESAAPLMLVPRRGPGPATVHLVNGAAAPLGGDDLDLTIEVGPGAELTVAAVAAAVLLPGHRPGGSHASVHMTVADGGALTYLPEPTVVTARAEHTATLRACLAGDVRLRTREVLVLGRSGESCGKIISESNITRDRFPLLRQRLVVGDAELDASVASLAGHRVHGTEVDISGIDSDIDPVSVTGGDWWSLVRLAPGATLTTALAPDAVTAIRHLDQARAVLDDARRRPG